MVALSALIAAPGCASVIAVPDPLPPAASTKYSAAVTVPDRARSSPVALIATVPTPEVGLGLTDRPVVTAPVTARLTVVELTTPQFPAVSWARTHRVCRPWVRVASTA